MPNFPKQNPVIFPAAVPYIEPTDLVLGGLGNGPNKIGQPLVDRTDFLKKAVEDIVANSQNLVVGRDVQAWAVILDAITALTANGVLRKNGSAITAVPRWVDNAIAGGRLTLETNRPFSNANAASDRVFYTPYTGNTIALYVSNEWQYFTFSELSFPLTGIATGKNADVFAIASGQNVTLSLEQWTSDTTRSVVLTRAEGVWVAANNFGRRYLGTLRTSAAAECTDSEGKRLLWNVQNRLSKSLLRRDPGNADWSYSGTAWRPMNNSTANRIEIVAGTSEGNISARIVGVSAANGQLALALNSTTNAIEGYGYGLAAGNQSTTVGSWPEIVPAVGFNFVQAVERAQGAPATFGPAFTAISGSWLC